MTTSHDRLGVITKAEAVDGGVMFTVKFDSDEAMEKAKRIMANLDRTFAELYDDHFVIGVATKDFYDGP
jgi:hypothetical protein